MTPDEIQLARTLAAHERWEWREGMRAREKGGTGVVLVLRQADSWIVATRQARDATWVDHGWLANLYPDLHDWPTVGALLGMVYAEPGARIRWRGIDGVYESPNPGPALARLLLEVWDAS